MRYLAAAERAQVGGDWYDAFPLADGVMAVVVGDVSGHDREAAVVMAQVRNLPARRGPLEREGAGDHARRPGAGHADPRSGGYATAVMAHVDATALTELGGAAGAGAPGVVVRWCNAGHPPPVLLAADGTATLLEAEADLMLGLRVETGRRDHCTELPPGSALVLYTDGLRGTSGDLLAGQAPRAARRGRVASST